MADFDGANSPVLDPSQLEKQFNIPRSTQAKGRMTGDFIPHLKVGRRILYLRTDVVEWLTSKRRRSTSQAALAEPTQSKHGRRND